MLFNIVYCNIIGEFLLAIQRELIDKITNTINSALEQSDISNYIDSITSKISTAFSCKEREIEKLKEYKATLINSAVTGKIKVSQDA